MISSKCQRREIRFYIAFLWLCDWVRGVEPTIFGKLFSGRFCQFLSPDRCGLLRLGVLIRYGEAGTDDCVEECAYFLLSEEPDYECGSCTINPTSPPTQEPEPSTFDIYLDLDVPLEHREQIRRVRDKWTNIIRSELSDVVTATELNGTTALEGNCEYPSFIDDLYLCIQYIDIDNAGGVVARTTILATRTSDGFPISARIRVDTDDVEGLITRGLFQDVVEHEIIHSLGFGILWGSKGLLNATKSTQGCNYTGSKASAEFAAVSGCRDLPNSCGHWDENCFGRELMTGALDLTNVVSRITIASMEDLGYDVDYSYADAFGLLDINATCTFACPRRNLVEINPNNNTDANTMVDNTVTHPIDNNTNRTEAQQQLRRHRRRRKLSDAGRANAIQHGREVLEQESSQSSKQPQNRTIYILYMEENEFYSIPVQSL